MSTTAVIGGGIAGLVAAWEIARHGQSVTLLEATPRVGGVIATEQVAGFLVEGGPDSFLAGRPEMMSLCTELGLAAELIRQRSRRVLAYDGLRLVELPPGKAAEVLELSTGGGEAGDVFSLRGGLGVVVDALAARLAGRIRTGARVVAVTRAGTGFRLTLDRAEAVEADAVILAVPAPVASGLVQQLDRDLATALAECAYGSSATISLAYPREAVRHPLDAAGLVIPREVARAVVACTFASSKFAARAPAGSVLLRAFVGRYGDASLLDADDAGLVTAVEGELEPLLGLSAPADRWRVFRWPAAIPRYDDAHRGRVAWIRERAAAADLLLAGAAYDGIGLSDCVASGRLAASTAPGVASVR